MKRKIHKSFEEQETTINIDPPSISKEACVYTSIPADIKTMWEIQKKFPDLVKVVADDKWGSEFKIPREWIVIKPKKVLSDEQKKALTKRLQPKSKTTAQKKKK